MTYAPPPLPDIKMPNIARAGKAAWNELALRVREKATTVRPGDHLRERLALLAHPLHRPDIRHRGDARALSWLWANEGRFLDRSPPTPAMLKHIADFMPPRRFSLIILCDWLRLYFNHYSQLPADASEAERSACAALRQQLRRILDAFSYHRKLPPFITRLRSHAEQLLSDEAHHTPHDIAQQIPCDFDDAFRHTGLDHICPRGSPFHQLALGHHYLDQISTLPDPDGAQKGDAGERDLLREIHEHREWSYGARQLGHEAIEGLIRRTLALGIPIPRSWRDAILDIAGDPRLPRAAASREQWWKLIDPGCTNVFSGWLSDRDLRLFLDIIERASKDSGDEDLQDMFPRRKRFMLKLLDIGLIASARVFISSEAQEWLESREDLSVHDVRQATLDYTRHTSAIHLAIAGQQEPIHYIEGTHNFSLWLYRALPPDSPIADYSCDNLSGDAVRNMHGLPDDSWARKKDTYHIMRDLWPAEANPKAPPEALPEADEAARNANPQDGTYTWRHPHAGEDWEFPLLAQMFLMGAHIPWDKFFKPADLSRIHARMHDTS